MGAWEPYLPTRLQKLQIIGYFHFFSSQGKSNECDFHVCVRIYMLAYVLAYSSFQKKISVITKIMISSLIMTD